MPARKGAKAKVEWDESCIPFQVVAWHEFECHLGKDRNNVKNKKRLAVLPQVIFLLISIDFILIDKRSPPVEYKICHLQNSI